MADSKIFEIFVQNRLKEIKNISEKENLHFGSTKNNPADILTREERKTVPKSQVFKNWLHFLILFGTIKRRLA